MNEQIALPRDYNPDAVFSINEIFRSIQGEGPFSGIPAVFIRFAGCNLQCPHCDTNYTFPNKRMNIDSILSEATELQDGGLVVITGGEPFRQSFKPLLEELLCAGYYIQIETNGTIKPFEFRWAWNVEQRYGAYIVCSPKTPKIESKALECFCALKYVIDADNVSEKDGLPLTTLGNKYEPAKPPKGWNRYVFVQPMDSGDPQENERHIKAALQSAMKFGYRFQFQIHKLLEIQ